jgi:hypothetical protein
VCNRAPEDFFEDADFAYVAGMRIGDLETRRERRYFDH